MQYKNSNSTWLGLKKLRTRLKSTSQVFLKAPQAVATMLFGLRAS